MKYWEDGEWRVGGGSGRWGGCRGDGWQKVRRKNGLGGGQGDFCSVCTCKPLDRA